MPLYWFAAGFGIPAVAAVVGRVIIAIYALRDTEPEERPPIIRALARMPEIHSPALPSEPASVHQPKTTA